MHFKTDQVSLLKKGSNSQILRFGEAGEGLVLKVVSSSDVKECKHLNNEYRILKKLTHPNIITVYKFKEGVCLSSKAKREQRGQKEGLLNVLALEYAVHGNLLDFYKLNRKNLSPWGIRFIFRQICEAVKYLHSNFIAHRDLKLQNILLCQQQDNIVVKLADFGFSDIFFDGQTYRRFNSVKGTRRGYMAPEIHKCSSSQGNQQKCDYDAQKADIFSLGVIFFALNLGKMPFQYAKQEDKLFCQIAKGNLPGFWANHSKELNILESLESSMCEEFKDLFCQMACPDPSGRIDICEVLDCEWFNGQTEPPTGSSP